MDSSGCGHQRTQSDVTSHSLHILADSRTSHPWCIHQVAALSVSAGGSLLKQHLSQHGEESSTRTAEPFPQAKTDIDIETVLPQYYLGAVAKRE